MSYATTLIVQNSDGSAATHRRCTLGFSCGVTREAYTDDHGHVLIEHESRGKADIFVSGVRVGSLVAPGRTAVVLR